MVVKPSSVSISLAFCVLMLFMTLWVFAHFVDLASVGLVLNPRPENYIIFGAILAMLAIFCVLLSLQILRLSTLAYAIVEAADGSLNVSYVLGRTSTWSANGRTRKSSARMVWIQHEGLIPITQYWSGMRFATLVKEQH